MLIIVLFGLLMSGVYIDHKATMERERIYEECVIKNHQPCIYGEKK